MIVIAGLPGTLELMRAIAAALESETGLASVTCSDLRDPGLRQTLQTAEILVTLGYPCTASEMDLTPALAGIVSPSLGYEWIDVPEATRRGIAVVNGEVIENRQSMAEATLMLVLVLLYRLHDTQAAFSRPWGESSIQRRMLKGKTVGVIGYGGIAQEVIQRLQPWQCDVVVHSRRATTAPGVRFTSLEELLRVSDVVIVLTSVRDDTRHLLNAERLALVKPGAVLVNTARGSLIDEHALVEALRAGRISAAALDVFATEPLPKDHPLRELENVILTPHAVGHTVEARAAIPTRAAQNVGLLVNGVLPAGCKNPEVADRWRKSRAARR